MSDALRTWLSEELDRRKWSQRELARQADISQAFVNRVLSGDLSPSINFCNKVAQALGEPPEKLLRLAGILPTSPASEDEQLIREVLDILKNMSPDQRKELLRYAHYLFKSGHGKG